MGMGGKKCKMKDVRSLLEQWYIRILAGKRIPPQNKAEGIGSNIDYFLKMFKFKVVKNNCKVYQVPILLLTGTPTLTTALVGR